MRKTSIALSVLLVVWASAAATGAERLTVSAAASLTNAFSETGEAFGTAEPGATVDFNFGPSGSLLQQIDQGAPVDVFACADRETMDRAESLGLIDRPSRRYFAANRLVLAVSGQTPSPVRSLQDLGKPVVRRVALGNPEFVPAGRYARQVLEDSGLWPALGEKLVLGVTVRQVLDYLARGEVDAGFVFATDVAVSRGKVLAVEEVRPRDAVRYPIAVVAGSPRRAAAQRFVDFVAGPEGRAILARHGFQPAQGPP